MASTNKNLLRISIDEGRDLLTIKLEGKLVGPTVEEFHRAALSLSPGRRQPNVNIDIRNVTFMDAAGVKALGQVRELTSAQIQADSPLTQYFAEKATESQRLKS